MGVGRNCRTPHDDNDNDDDNDDDDDGGDDDDGMNHTVTISSLCCIIY